ncbi:Reverse transcriptase-RNase H-integrase [Mycena venus]|uniref:Reverse transcriptase-RNase H-integrase n=1 Tax=Mycena venus TaxID=2733690 RepID=A0A8H7CXQ2_9AGAR|nr:Reverse transcriptase-RNase H-integrase [Mycena venus]
MAKKIVSGSNDTTVHIWDAETGTALCELLEGHTNTVTSVAFSPDGKRIVSGSNDKTVCIWDAETGAALREPLKGHTDRVTSVEFSPDAKKIVSGSNDRTMCIWDAETGAALGKPLEGHTDTVTSVAFSPDGKRIVSGSNDKTVCIWDAETGAALKERLEGHTHWVTSVTFSPDGKKIGSGSEDKTVRIWDAVSGAALRELQKGHTNTVTSVALSPSAPLHWKIHNGWVSHLPSELLFWLPMPYRFGPWSPHNTLVIGQEQTLLSYENFFEDVFNRELFDSLLECQSWDHAIELILDTKPANCKVYPISPLEQKELNAFIKEGLRNTMMNDIFQDLILSRDVMVYLNNILIAHADLAQHREIIQECEFEKLSIEYLGVIISYDRVEMDPVKVAGVAAWLEPHNKKDVQQFLGFTNFYQQFIWAFLYSAQALFDLMKKGVPWDAITSEPVLVLLDESQLYQLEADSSDFTTGAVLLQPDADGKWHPVAFYSKSLSEVQHNYEIHNKEMLTIVWALEEWCHFLEGTQHLVKIWTDHKNLEYFWKAQNLN